MPTNFEHTRKALQVWNDGAAAREEAWVSVETEQDINNCYLADVAAGDEVRKAFYEDTQAYNSLESCMRIHIVDIKEIVSYFPK